MGIRGLDHFVMTVENLNKPIDFYTNVLGLKLVEDEGRFSLHFGNNKINIHEFPGEFQLVCRNPTPGTQDFCFLVAPPLLDFYSSLLEKDVKLETDIVERMGAMGNMKSFYLYDPDRNLVEISSYE